MLLHGCLGRLKSLLFGSAEQLALSARNRSRAADGVGVGRASSERSEEQKGDSEAGKWLKNLGARLILAASGQLPRGPPACPPGLVTNALRQPGNHSCHRKVLSVWAGSQRPAAAGAPLRAGSLIISAVGAGAPGSTAAQPRWRSCCRFWKLRRGGLSCQRKPPGAAGLEIHFHIISVKPSSFRSGAWARPGFSGTNSAFVPPFSPPTAPKRA